MTMTAVLALALPVAADAGDVQDALDVVRPLIGASVDEARRALRRPEPCTVTLAHPPGCTFFSCCDPGRVQVHAVCGTIGRRSARSVVALLPADGVVVGVRVVPADGGFTGLGVEDAVAVWEADRVVVADHGGGLTAWYDGGVLARVALVDVGGRHQSRGCRRDPGAVELLDGTVAPVPVGPTPDRHGGALIVVPAGAELGD